MHNKDAPFSAPQEPNFDAFFGADLDDPTSPEGAPAEPAPQPVAPDPKTISFERCFELVVMIGKALPNPAEGARFEPGLAAVLWRVLAGGFEQDQAGAGVYASVPEIAAALNLTAHQVRDRLARLAAFGLIRVTNRRAEGRGFVHVGVFYANPLMVQLVLKSKGRRLTRSAIEPFLAMGLARDPAISRPQGWQGYDVEYGEDEPTPGTPAAMGRQLAPWAAVMGDDLEAIEEAAAAASICQSSARLRAQERIRRAANAEAFIGGLATVWQQAHEKRGFGILRPAWDGPYEQLSPENKKQARELRALFEKNGGQRVAMAWAVFCHYETALDAKGRPRFDPKYPHTQWVSHDKKPNQFGKHFDAIFMDEFAKSVMANPESIERIKATVGPTFAAPPCPPLAVAAKKGAAKA